MTKAKIRDLVFGYDEQNLIVDGLSLFYETPDVLCVLGANGAGKSTLLQCASREALSRHRDPSASMEPHLARTPRGRLLA